MGLEAIKQEQKFTYADYLSWDDNQRWEIIHGEAYILSPAPATDHQAISTELLYQIRNQLKEGACKIFHAPFDVRLPLKNEKEEEVENVV